MCKASRKHRDKKHRDKKQKDRDRGGVNKGAAAAGGSTVERLRAERREREAAEHVRQQRMLQQPIARCAMRFICRVPQFSRLIIPLLFVTIDGHRDESGLEHNKNECLDSLKE